MIFQLLVRNVSWRIIREVRTHKESQRYNGFDKARRQLVNNIFQGGTADVARLMMMQSQPLCKATRAKIILQIHDELVFEVPWPGEWWRFMDFIRRMREILEQPPSSDFKVPIVVEPKIGKKFGEMRAVADEEYLLCRIHLLTFTAAVARFQMNSLWGRSCCQQTTAT